MPLFGHLPAGLCIHKPFQAQKLVVKMLDGICH